MKVLSIVDQDLTCYVIILYYILKKIELKLLWR